MWQGVASALGSSGPPPTVAVLRLAGVIADRTGPLRRGELALTGLARGFERAFALPNLRAVALQINSPGGAPVQAALIERHLRALSAERAVPILAFVEDVAASGGYWIALAAEEIYADENSIVGSIGVVSAGFGFTELMARVGVERRLFTAGTRKAMLDPFSPLRDEDVARLRAVQDDMHETFKALVRLRRAPALKGDERELFSGEFWTGRRAFALGLIDGLGDMRAVLRARFGPQVRLTPVGERRSFLLRPFGIATGGPPAVGGPTGAFDLAAGALAAVEDRLAWSRFGL